MGNLFGVSEIVDETKMDIPGSLPIEIFHKILQYLSTQDLYNACKCCRKWKNHMESFWRRKCIIEQYFECEDDLNSKYYRDVMENYYYWEGIYLYNSMLRKNWLSLNYKEIVVQHDFNNLPSRGLDPKVYYISDDVIISSTGTIKKELLVINCTTGVVEFRIFPPFDQTLGVVSIDAVEIFENQLIVIWKHVNSLRYDINLPVKIYFTVWDIATGELLTNSKKEIYKVVHKVKIYKNLVTVMMIPYGAYIFNITTGNLDYDQWDITTVCHYNDKIILGNKDGTIVMMDLGYTKLMTFKCCTDKQTILHIVMEKNYLVSGCQGRPSGNYFEYCRACIWNIETKTKLYKVENITNIYDITLFVDEKKLWYPIRSRYFNSTMFKLCHLDTGKCLFELHDHKHHGFTNYFLIIQRDKENHRSLIMRSIKTGKLLAKLDTISPYTDLFFNTCYFGTKKTKTKIAHFKYKLSALKPPEATLNIINFQPELEI